MRSNSWTDSHAFVHASFYVEQHAALNGDSLDWREARRARAALRRDLLEIVEERYGNGVTLITSQIPVDRWHGFIGEPAIADAILDRIVHSAHRLKLKGDSPRKKAHA